SSMVPSVLKRVTLLAVSSRLLVKTPSTVIKRGCAFSTLANNLDSCSPEPTMTTLRENTCLAARYLMVCAAKIRASSVAAHADNAKVPVKIREYSMEIFNANAAANKKAKVVAKTMTTLSTILSGCVTASNSYRPAKLISIIETSQTNATAAA